MNTFEILLIAVAVSMDAFAVSIAKGICNYQNNKYIALKLALAFGLFQALMPVFGYYFTSLFSDAVNEYSPYISFTLLVFIAVKMILESNDTDEECRLTISLSEIIMLAIATSIDAFAIGATFALIENIHIYYAVSIIGITTFAFSYFGVKMGKRLGNRFEKYSEIFGSIILLIIAFRVLLQHLL